MLRPWQTPPFTDTYQLLSCQTQVLSEVLRRNPLLASGLILTLLIAGILLTGFRARRINANCFAEVREGMTTQEVFRIIHVGMATLKESIDQRGEPDPYAIQYDASYSERMDLPEFGARFTFVRDRLVNKELTYRPSLWRCLKKWWLLVWLN